jgi:hypothetical protein
VIVVVALVDASQRGCSGSGLFAPMIVSDPSSLSVTVPLESVA